MILSGLGGYGRRRVAAGRPLRNGLAQTREVLVAHSGRFGETAPPRVLGNTGRLGRGFGRVRLAKFRVLIGGHEHTTRKGLSKARAARRFIMPAPMPRLVTDTVGVAARIREHEVETRGAALQPMVGGRVGEVLVELDMVG
jgi:hypothetical protein